MCDATLPANSARVEAALINDLDPEAIAVVAARSRQNSRCSNHNEEHVRDRSGSWSSGKNRAAPTPPLTTSKTSLTSKHSKHSITKSSTASALDQDCANLKYNLSLRWWKYDTRKRRQCFMWLGFCVFLLLVVVAMAIILSNLTGGYKIDNTKEPFKDIAIDNRKDVETFKVDRLQKLPSFDDGLILMIGGYGPNGKDVEVITGKGSCNLPYGYPKRLPVSLVGHMAGTYGGDKIIVCGGLEKEKLQKEVLNRKCWTYSVNTNTWNLMSSSMLWPVAYASSVVSPDDAKFFIFGGNDDGTVRRDSQVLNLNDMTWSLGPRLHSPLWGHCSVIFGSKLVVIGGWNTSPKQVDQLRTMRSVHALNGEVWQPMQPLRYARSTHGCAVTNFGSFGQAIIVAGGMGVHQNSLDSVEILRIDKGAVMKEVRWQQLRKMNKARSWYPAVGRLDKRLLVAGGETGIASDQFSIEFWNPLEKHWNILNDGRLKPSKSKSANVFLNGIFQNCFIEE